MEIPEVAIYEAVSTELLSQSARDYMTSLSLNSIKHIAIFNNQYKYEKLEKSYSLPAVFIEFSVARFDHKGKRIDNVRDTVRIHVEQKNLADGAQNSVNKAQALDVLKTIHAVHSIVDSIESTEFGRLHRIGREIDSDHGNAPVHIWTYEIMYTDDSTNKYKGFVKPAEDQVNLNANKQLVEKLEIEEEEENEYRV